ncbi:P-loop containing nucleoside triphosphate hydrolase protein [Hyaloraphidium curvatum]|nr:P-loop containing nucleoside triphosphate hydrolase protein [Hyaloraphidium curvatum]
MPAPLGELTEAVLADLPGGKDGERGRRMIFQERCLTMPEIEKVVAMAMGARAAPAGPPTPLPEEGEPPAARVKATGLAAVRAQTVDAADVGKFLRIGAEASLLREAARSGAGGEHAEAFADPAERLKIDQYEERILRECFVKPSRMDASFATIGGIAKTKRIVQELIQLPLQRPELFGTGILKQTTTGILLFGPPGTGKTLLARAVAAEAGANFLNVQMSHLQHMYVGENEKHTRALFTLARKLRPCVVFVDEIDSLLKSRRNGLPSYASNTINEFMAEWDGIQSENRGVIVVGCTNRPFDLDEAVLRRMPRRIMVDLPDEAERREILGILLRDETIGDGPEERADIIAAVAKRTESFSGSDLKNLSIAAAMNSIREQILGRPEHATDRILRFTHFERALEDGDVVPSVNERNEVIKELKAWDKQYGSGAGGYRGHSTIGFL